MHFGSVLDRSAVHKRTTTAPHVLRTLSGQTLFQISQSWVLDQHALARKQKVRGYCLWFRAHRASFYSRHSGKSVELAEILAPSVMTAHGKFRVA